LFLWKQKKIFSELSQLDSNREVRSIGYLEKEAQINIYIDYVGNEGFCPKTGELSSIYDYRGERKWQHLSL
jgi:hypothetical protein